MVMKKRRRLCGLLVLLCVFLTACSAAAETEPVSISFMHGWGGSGADHVGMRELFAEFEAENPDIHIVYDTSPDLGIVMEKAADMLAVDKTPNIISTNGNVQYVSNATKKGYPFTAMGGNRTLPTAFHAERKAIANTGAHNPRTRRGKRGTNACPSTHKIASTPARSSASSIRGAFSCIALHRSVCSCVSCASRRLSIRQIERYRRLAASRR